MANIPALPTGRAILDKGKAKVGTTSAYGPGGCSIAATEGSIALRDTALGTLVSVSATGYSVDLDRVMPDNVGYVNRFIADWGLVKRDWRTKTYRLVSGMTDDLAEAVENAPEMPRTVMAPAPVGHPG